MRFRLRSALLAMVVNWLTFGAAPPTTWAIEPPSAPPQRTKFKPADVVERLGDRSFAVREGATLWLTGLGLQCRAELEAGLDHADPEVRRRCRQILSDVLYDDLQKRIDRFAAGQPGPPKIDLPGWNEYQQVYGDTTQSRQLFIAMLREEPALMDAFDLGGEILVATLRQRLGQLYRGQTARVPAYRSEATMGSIAAVLFVVSQTADTLPDDILSSLALASVAQQSGFANELRGGNSKDTARKLFGRWLMVPSGRINDLQKLRLAIMHDIRPEGAEMAVQIFSAPEGPGAIQAQTKATCIEAIARLGGKSCAALLKPALEDETVCMTMGVNRNGKVEQIQIQVRDVAIAWLVELTGQNHAEYGMPNAKQWFEQIRKSRTAGINFSMFVYKSPADRDKALAKWRKWEAANPLPDVPERYATLPPRGKTPKLSGKGVDDPPADEAEKDDRDASAPLGLRMAERYQVTRLDAAERFIANGHFADAMLLLGPLLAADEDFVFRDADNGQVFRTIKSTAEHLMGQLPAATLDQYELQYGAKAARELQRALSAGRPDQIAHVADSFFYTQAGAEARFLIGCMLLDQGEFLAAAFQFKRLIDWPAAAATFEPAVSLKLATCWYEAGLPEKAEGALQQLKLQWRQPTVNIGNTQVAMFDDPADALSWLEKNLPLVVGQAAAPAAVAHADDAAKSSHLIPFLEGDPVGVIVEDETAEKAIDTIRDEEKLYQASALPSFEPQVVGGLLVYRTLSELQAVDMDSRQLRWKVRLDGALEHFLRRATPEQRQSQSAFLAAGLRSRLNDDKTFGALASDGRRIFLVENLGFEFAANYQSVMVRPDGRHLLQNDVEAASNALSAWDAENGKLLWQVGGGQRDASQPLAGAFFLGAPLAIGKQLCVVAEIDEQVCLLMLDAEDGRLIWQCTLAINEGLSDNPAALQLVRSLGWSRPLRRYGSRPVLADEMVICYAGDGSFAAVDLVKRRVAWVYEQSTSDAQPAANLRNFWQLQQQLAQRLQQRDKWIDPTPVAGDDYVLLTHPETDLLVCLNRADGSVRWTALREDGLYVAGAEQGTVLIVGRSSVRGMHLANGEPVWSPAAVPLPDGAVPSGVGYLHDGTYYVPLSSAEVAAFDIAAGRWQTVSQSLTGIVPGNLVVHGDVIVSQDRAKVYRFDGLTGREQQLAERLRATPDDPQLLAALGETLLYDGRLDEAIPHVTKAVELNPNQKNKNLLSRAVVAGLRRGEAKYRDQAEQFEPLLDGEARTAMLRELGSWYEREKQPLAAFQAYIRFIEAKPDLHQIYKQSSAWQIRNDRWLLARLAGIRGASSPSDGEEIDRLIAGQREKLPAAEFVRIFGFHPLATNARLELATDLAAKNRLLAAEQTLRYVIQNADQPQRREATARLADVLRGQKKNEAAARYYAQLAGPLAGEVCLNGKTGRQLFDALPDDDRVRRWLQPQTLWPAGPISAKHVRHDRKTGLPQVQVAYPLTLVAQSDELDCPVTLGMEFTGIGRLTARDSLGRPFWSVEMPRGNQGFNTVQYGRGRAEQRGHLFVCWVGDTLVAVDATDGKGKLLWSQRTILPSPTNIQVPQFRMAFRVPRQSTALRDSVPLPFTTAQTYVCYQYGPSLRALDPLTGDLLWERDDVPEQCDIFGDDEMIFVTGVGSEQADVFSAVDGRRLGKRAVPTVPSRVAVSGRRVLTWQTKEDAERLALVDPWLGEVVWESKFDRGSQIWPLNNSETAVLQTDGYFAVVDSLDGHCRTEARLESLADLQSIFVHRWTDRYVVMTRVPDKKPLVHHMPYAHASVNGPVYGVSAASGKVLWRSEVTSQHALQSAPTSLPILIFFSRQQNTTRRANGGITYGTPSTKILCLDLRNGKQVYKSESPSGYDYYYRLETDPEKGTIELRTRMDKLTLTCSGSAS